jgi:hypothetical protein
VKLGQDWGGSAETMTMTTATGRRIPDERSKMSHGDPERQGTDRASSLDDFDRAIIKFVIQWAPYGGPSDEDLFPRFGLTRDRLFARIESIIRAQTEAPVPAESDRELIRTVARVLASSRREADSAGSSDSLALPPNVEWRKERGVWRAKLLP